MKTIITIQHTQAVHHTNGMVGSWTDWELTDLGKERAENIGRRLSGEIGEKPCKIYCSDLTRTKQTAEPLLRYLGTNAEYRADFREIFSGAASIGKSSEWLIKNRAWSPDVISIDNKPFDDAESIREAYNRAAIFRDEILAADNDIIIVISHGGILPLFFAAWLGWDAEALLSFGFYGAAGGVSFLQKTDNSKRVISRLNDMSYSGEDYRLV
ncbi:histidine phosphatase family protein [Clostridia bacterium]|nr:histidine phosphatase family protein [Clostridia bacterium]